MNTTTKLYLEFKDERGDTFNVVVDDPKDNLDESLILFNMNAIIQANAFENKGSELKEVSAAYKREVVKTVFI